VKVTSIETIPVDVPIDATRAIAGSRGAHTRSPFLILRVHTDEGVVGLGEVSCTPRWSGEDQVASAHLIHAYLEPALVGKDPCDIARNTRLLERALANNPFTRAGIEIALWDILGKVANQPLWRMWGEAQRDFVPTKFSVSGLEPQRAAAIAAWAVEQGFRAMKVKVGTDLETDLARVRAVRDAVGPDVKLGVDANGGWAPWVALAAIEPLHQLNVAFLEQPVSWVEPAWMAAVRARSPMPVLGDESVSTVFDAITLIQASAVDAFSIYIGKGGGLGMARRIGTVAGAAGLACTVGSNLELGIASAAMIHLGMVLPEGSVETFPCDILSVFFYEDMLLTEPLPVEAGYARPLEAPGLGVELDPQRLARYRVQ
jgi:L-alanine-DL-glutamate epimerase-like enolase superfamily enzyme